MMRAELTGLDAADPLGFMAAVGALRVLSRTIPSARLGWQQTGSWTAALTTPEEIDVEACVQNDLERWRRGHMALDFAVGAERKIQDLKHPPEDFRALMRTVANDEEAASFVAAMATGVAVDGTGQTKPTSIHLTAGQQRFMDAVLSLREEITKEDIHEALFGPWIGRKGPKDLRWRAASDRYRALLSYDPGKETGASVPAATWLAFQALPVFPVVAVGRRAVTTGFSGRGKRETFAWPVWEHPLSLTEIRTLLGTPGLATTDTSWREARGVVLVFESTVVRSSQGYGNFAAADPR